jgi:hypothetical protein
VPIPAEELQKLEREWRANQARQRLQESVRRLESGEFTIELERAPDDPDVGEPAFQGELNGFASSLQKAGVPYRQRAFAMDSMEARGFPLPEFIIAIKTLGPHVITAVAGYAVAWIQARATRKLRIRIGEIEAEARTLAEIEALLNRAVRFQDESRAEIEGRAPHSSNTEEIIEEVHSKIP